MTQHALVKVVAGCVIRKDDKILMVQEKKKKVYGLWNFPAGRVDEGESIVEAAKREVLEETGFVVEVGEQVGMYHSGMDDPVVHHFYAEIISGELQFQEEELIDAQWFDYEELQTLEKKDKLRSIEVWATVKKVFESSE